MYLPRIYALAVSSLFATCLIVSGQLGQPQNVRVVRYLTSGAEIQWDQIGTIDLTGITYQIQFRRVGEINWRYVQSVSKPVLLIPLLNGESYQVQLRAAFPNLVSPWSNVFAFTMPKSPPSQRLVSAPSNLQASVVTSTSVHLRWTSFVPLEPNSEDMYYVVLMQELSPSTNVFGNDRSIFVKSKTFLLENLQMGLTYKFQVKIHTGHDESPFSESVTVQMPREAELYAITNVSVVYSDEEPGYVNLTWIVPEVVKKEVSGYSVWYSTVKESEQWNEVFINANEQKATLGPLPSNVTMYFSVEMHLHSGSSTESNVFQFLTPFVKSVEDVNIVYTPDVGTLKMQWKLASTISSKSVLGYEVVMSKNASIPENQWNRFVIQGSDPLLIVNSLQPSTQYYAKIYIRKDDGTIMPSGTTYQFATLGQPSSMAHHVINVTYQRLSPSVCRIKWAFPDTMITFGSLVLYTNEPNRPDQDWMKIMVPDNRTEVLITGLLNNTSYYVKILPRNATTTISMETGVFRINPNDPLNIEIRSELVMASKIKDMVMESSVAQAQVLCLKACHSVGECATNDKCVMVDRHMGFCIPEIILRAVKP